MFRNVIVGVDGRDGGRDAIALARHLIGTDGTLTLGCICRDEPDSWGASSAASETPERKRSHELLEQARAEAGVDAQLRVHRALAVGRGLPELAEALPADLLVIGSSRRGLIGRVLIGDDTRAALNGAPCAVAIAPAGYAQHPAVIREIGVGYNGSREAEHALSFARKLAGDLQTRLSALEAVSFPAYMFMGPPLPDATAIEALVDAARERLASIEGVEPHAAYGQAAEELALYSASLDLLVLGSREYGQLGRLVHGSTSQQLARSARCPLLVLTRAAHKLEPAGAAREESRTGVVAGTWRFVGWTAAPASAAIPSAATSACCEATPPCFTANSVAPRPRIPCRGPARDSGHRPG